MNEEHTIIDQLEADIAETKRYIAECEEGLEKNRFSLIETALLQNELESLRENLAEREYQLRNELEAEQRKIATAAYDKMMSILKKLNENPDKLSKIDTLILQRIYQKLCQYEDEHDE